MYVNQTHKIQSILLYCHHTYIRGGLVGGAGGEAPPPVPHGHYVRLARVSAQGQAGQPLLATRLYRAWTWSVFCSTGQYCQSSAPIINPPHPVRKVFQNMPSSVKLTQLLVCYFRDQPERLLMGMVLLMVIPYNYHRDTTK